MSAQTWTVDVGGKKHTIRVDQDSQLGRAAIRVDGRIVAKPMSAGETEREVPVGSARYVIRRLDGGKFDLDIPPEVFLNRALAESSPSKSKSGIGKWIGFAVVALIVIGLLRFGRYGLQYMRVAWEPYASPDGTFKAKFPIKPTSAMQSQNINGDMWTVNSLYTEYKNHGYAVQYVDLKIVVVEANAESIMDRFFTGWMGAMGAKVENREKTSLARNPAFSFVAWIPAGAGPADKKLEFPARMRGLLALRDRRLFLVWTVAALGDPFSHDLRQFLDGFQAAPPPEGAAKLIVEPAPAVEEKQQPVVEAQRAAAEAAEARQREEIATRREEIATRRAAEPQIYLEKEWMMYHVAGCPAVTPRMERIAIEQRTAGYTAHVCVPDDVRNWTWKR